MLPPIPAETAITTLPLLAAAILGLVEGITEYLPVSSTGHLILTSSLLGLYDGGARERAVHDFEIIIQGGAILAVLGLYFPKFVRMVRGLMGQDAVGLRLLINVIIAFIPAAAVGLAFNKQIKAALFNPLTVILAMIIGGAFMLIVDLLLIQPRKRRAQAAIDASTTGPSAISARSDGAEVESLSPAGALSIGLLQIFSLIPGTSRSMMTIVGGIMTGLRPAAAAEFSFLLGMPTLLAATLYSLYKNIKETSAAGEPNLFTQLGLAPVLLGMAVAAISAALAVKWLVAFLNRYGLAPFGYYRLAMGALMVILLSQGLLTAGTASAGNAGSLAKPPVMVPVKVPVP